MSWRNGRQSYVWNGKQCSDASTVLNGIILSYYGGQQERIGMQRRLLKKRVPKDDVSDSSIEEQSDDDEQVSPYCFDVMLTTYQTAFQKFDRAFLRKFDLSYLILDEAHNIKNKSSISFQALFKLNTQCVLAPLLLSHINSLH